MAMIAALCCAFAAIAAIKLNTRLKLHPPKKTKPTNERIFSKGLPRNKIKRNKLNPLIASINKELNNNFDKIKCWGLTIV